MKAFLFWFGSSVGLYRSGGLERESISLALSYSVLPPSHDRIKHILIQNEDFLAFKRVFYCVKSK